MADWLIFGHAGGLSLAMFVTTLGAMVVAANPLRAGWHAQILAATLLTAGIVSLVNDLNLLSFCCGLVSLTAFAAILTSKRLPDWPAILRRAALLPVAGPFRLIADLWRIYRLSPLKRGWSIGIAFALTWVAPVLLFGVFLALLTSANPVIELWFRSLDFRMPSGHFDPIRAVFWIFILLVTWPLLHVPSLLKKPNPPTQSVPTVATGDASIFFAEPAIVRSLLLL